LVRPARMYPIISHWHLTAITPPFSPCETTKSIRFLVRMVTYQVTSNVSHGAQMRSPLSARWSNDVLCRPYKKPWSADNW
jgi:hypothetical protein